MNPASCESRWQALGNAGRVRLALLCCEMGGVALHGESGVASPAYRAFISYSHVDQIAAARLHRQLERYRLPKRLVGEETARGPVPDRLTPIFRDLDELPASDDLNAEIKAALAASGALIVLCSPSARASRWVNREIELFRDIHGNRRPILSALVDGAPETAFPPQLTVHGAEPVAADLRKQGDGSHHGLLKLVAGITGVSLDRLIQRDAQQRLRRVTAITGLALMAVLVMALLLVAAIRARSEAVRQRAEAEGLVEYMLTDLRDRLKGVGRLDVMTAVNERAMNYYDDQADLSGLPPESLARRARILHAMGEDDGDRGNFEKSLAKFREAHRATAAVLKQVPRDGDALFAHAQSEYWIGYAADQLEDGATTEKHWRGYLTQANQLANVEPGTVRSLMEQGYAHGNLCALLQKDAARRPSAREHCMQSVAFEEKALAKAPDDPEIMAALANRLGWNAVLDLRERRLQDALANREREALLLARLLEKDSKNAEFATRRIWNEQGKAAALDKLGRSKEAAAFARQSISGVEALIRLTGRTPKLVELLLKGEVALATSLKNAGDSNWQAALGSARATLVEFGKTDRAGPSVERYASLISSLEEGRVK